MTGMLVRHFKTMNYIISLITDKICTRVIKTTVKCDLESERP